jgi:hypothetical protein
MRLLRYFSPSVTAVAIAIIALGLGAGVYGVLKAHARMAVEAELRAACREELRQLERRQPVLATYVKPDDACLALRVVRAGR